VVINPTAMRKIHYFQRIVELVSILDKALRQSFTSHMPLTAD
jgi:hypothetical protein